MTLPTRFSRAALIGLVTLAALGVGARAATAQTGASAVVGIATDSSGAVLPGVTVEARSPALIERVKTAVTSPDGSFQIIDLRPGDYDVSFTLSGFQTVKYAAVHLDASFIATLNAKLPTGGIETTVTVMGSSPVVDVRSNVSEHALTQHVLDAVPAGRMPIVSVMLVPGAQTNLIDVGGSQIAQFTSLSIHGSATRDVTWNIDGLNMTSNTGTGGVTGQYPNEGAIQEISVQTKALPAVVSGGGANVNLISKDGGSIFSGDALASFTGSDLQSDNVSASERALGLTAPSATDRAYEYNANFGGPLLKNRLWFFSSGRRFRVDKFLANQFNTDKSQALDPNLIWNATGKLTWQASSSTRVSGYIDYNSKLRTLRRDTTSNYQFISSEASFYSPLWGPVTNLKATSVVRSTFLVDAGFSWYHIPWAENYQPGIAPDAISRDDIALSTLTGASAPSMPRANQERRTWSGVATWLPHWEGTHNVQFGAQFFETPYGQTFDALGHGDFIAQYRNGVPNSVLVYNTPVTTSVDEYDFGAFLQDSWTIGNHLTINGGARFERFAGRLNQQSAPPGEFVGARTFGEVDDIPKWKTIVPRLAVAYNLFADGRTVVKANVSQYMESQGSALVTALDPMRLNTESRTWNDANHDLVPQLGEIGPSLGTLDQGANVRVDPNLQRPYQWEYTASIEHQLARDLGVTISYYRREYRDQTTTLNEALSPSDYTPVTITSPLTGLPFVVYNQNPATKGRVDNVLTNSSSLNTNYNGVELVVDKRLSRGSLIYGGLTVGANKGCYAASTNPNALINSCGYDPLDSKVLLNVSGVRSLPYGIAASAHFYFATGQPLARTYTVSSVDVPGLTQVTQSVNLAQVGDVRKPSQKVLDVRLSKAFRVSHSVRIEPTVDVYNVLNENAATAEVTIVGPALGQISSNVEGRTLRLGGKLFF